ncbi:MAG TPA: FHA domain-containing protein [Solirubrobacteraceae bacterium]|jgi:hypothetical protein|nr:FHA domain-containing protein [Solirubrobacteraceae bacterium]
MSTILLILALLAIGWLVYNRRRVVAGVPVLQALATALGGSGQPGELAPLIAALYSSITDKSRRTWWTRTHHVSGESWTIVAAPADAAILAGSIRAVEADLNAALADNASRHRIVIDSPVRIQGVLSDPGVAAGRPKLRPGPAAQAPQAATQPRPGVRPSSADRAMASTPRSKLDAEWEAPTNLAETIGETFVASPETVRLWPIGPGAGRDPIVVPASGIVLGRSPDLGAGRIASRTVSGRHAELRREGEAWVLRDLGSHNGTFLGARRVDEAKVQSGDVIGLGRHFRVRLIVGEQPLESAARRRG